MIRTISPMRTRYLYNLYVLWWLEKVQARDCSTHTHFLGLKDAHPTWANNTVYNSSGTTLSPILASALLHIETLDTRGLQSNSVRSSEGLSSWWCIYCIAVLLILPPFDPDLVFSAAETRYLKEWLKHFYKPRIIFSSLSSLMNLETVGNFW